jgi:hypothetical protein
VWVRAVQRPTPPVLKLPAPFQEADTAVSLASSSFASASSSMLSLSSSSQDSQLEEEVVEAGPVKTVKKEAKPLLPSDWDSYLGVGRWVVLVRVQAWAV